MNGWKYYLMAQKFRIDIPVNVNLKITETTLGVRGDSANNVTKSATVETGATVNVPCSSMKEIR